MRDGIAKIFQFLALRQELGSTFIYFVFEIYLCIPQRLFRILALGNVFYGEESQPFVFVRMGNCPGNN